MMPKALQLRKAGLGYAKIGEQLGCTHEWARQLCLRGFAEYGRMAREEAQEHLATVMARTESQIQALWPKAMAGNIGANEQIRKITETQCKLAGLFAPVKIAPTNPDGTSEYGIGLAALLREGD